MALSGFPWDELSGPNGVRALQRFIGDQDHESQHWEAKGVGPDSKGSPRAASLRKEVAAFANSVDGGVVLLGVEEVPEGRGWTFPGVTLADPPTWVSDALKYNIDPRPTFEVRELPLDAGGAVIAIRVWPVASAPCMVNGGAIYERLPGCAAKVEFPQRLADLYARGNWARGRAREQAKSVSVAALEHLIGPSVASDQVQRLVIGASPIADSPSAERLVFSSEGRDRLVADINVLTSRPHHGDGEVSLVQSQHGVKASAVRFDKTCRWEVTLRRDGSVAVLWSALEGTEPASYVTEKFAQAWELADAWVSRLGQFSEPQEQCINVFFTDQETDAVTRIDRLALMSRGPTTRLEAIGSASREVRRVFGDWIDEPRP